MPPTTLNESDWINILKDTSLTSENDLSIFQILYSFDDHKTYASQIGTLLGYKISPQSPVNLEIGRYAKRIASVMPCSIREIPHWK